MGPSTKSYRDAAAQAAARETARRAALRSRPGLVDLAEWRAGVEAARFLLGTLHDPPWLAGVEPRVGPEGQVELVIWLHWETEMLRRCLPTRVNGLRVRVEVCGKG